MKIAINARVRHMKFYWPKAACIEKFAIDDKFIDDGCLLYSLSSGPVRGFPRINCSSILVDEMFADSYAVALEAAMAKYPLTDSDYPQPEPDLQEED